MAGNSKSVLVLQPRDRRLLSELTTLRITDRELAKVVAGFSSTTRANARLLRLTRAGLLHRFFVGTISGGRKAIYTLSRRGRLETGTEQRPISRAHGKTLLGDLFVDHQMHVNDIYAMLKFRHSPEGVQFLRWRTLYEPVSQNSRLIPDGYFELQTSQGIRATFLEVDLGHQAMKVWREKVRSYLQLAISGDFNRIFGRSQFRVVVVTTSPRRLAGIRAEISRQTDKMFWLSDFQTINRAGFWSTVWHRPTSDQPLALI